MNGSLDEFSRLVSDSVTIRLGKVFVTGSDPEDRSDSFIEAFSRGVQKGVENFFLTSPDIRSSFLDEHPIFLATKISTLIGLSPEQVPKSSLLYRLRRIVLSEVSAYVQTDSRMVDRKNRRQRERESDDRLLTHQILEASRDKLKLDTLDLSQELAGGLSGSKVFRVYSSSNGQPSRLCVLKTTTDRKSYESEKDGFDAAKASWIGDFCAPEYSEAVLSIGDKQYFALMLALAFPPSTFSQSTPSLHELLVARNIPRARGVTSRLGKEYARVFWELSTTQVDTAADFCKRLTSKWKKFESKIDDDEFWYPIELPSASEPVFHDFGTDLPNPLHVLSRSKFRIDGKVEFHLAIQHGDLNARNILVPYEAPRQNEVPALIDFEKVGQSSALLDICYLAFFILEASLPTASYDESSEVLPKSFVSSIVSGRVPDDIDHGFWQFGLQRIAELSAPSVKLANTPEMKHALSIQLHLTLGVVGLLRAYFEVNSLYRERKSDLREVTFWAKLYFRIAATSLEPLADGEV